MKGVASRPLLVVYCIRGDPICFSSQIWDLKSCAYKGIMGPYRVLAAKYGILSTHTYFWAYIVLSVLAAKCGIELDQ